MNTLKPAEIYTHTHTHTHTQLKRCLAFLFIFNLFPAFANNSQDIDFQIKAKEQTLAQLKQEMSEINSELARCKKAQKGWIAATVVGGVGTVATGTAAIVQGVKLSKQNKKSDNTPKKDNQESKETQK